MTSEEDLRDQLVGLVDSRCVDPLEILLQDSDAVAALRARVSERAAVWAYEMVNTDDNAAIGAIMRVVAALYPSDEPFDPPVDWWRTPMGQITARRVGHPTAVRVPYPVAGAMLGISRQGVHDLIRRDKLARHPEGGVVPSSIRDRLREDHPA